LVLGLIGKSLVYSFSPAFFASHLDKLGLTKSFSYSSFELNSLDGFIEWAKELKPLGLNVTIPYKERILEFVDFQSAEVKEIGAANTLLFKDDGSISAYNTDCIGFEKSLFSKPTASQFSKALILGSGGASKAIQFVLKSNQIHFDVAGRNTQANISFYDLPFLNLSTYDLIINCTPLGTFPNTNECPPLLYNSLHNKQIVFDLVYNPSPSLLLEKALNNGCTVLNGYEMLEIQALSSWDIWYRYSMTKEEGLFL
jgi:shikimate dehydrogenase